MSKVVDAGAVVYKQDFTQLDNATKELFQKFPKVVKLITERVAGRWAQLIEEKAPKDTGEYAKSWSIEDISVTGGSAVAKVTSPYGKLFTILEFKGRKPQRIEAKKASSIHFKVGGVDVFVKWVDHPGFPPDPHVRPARDQALRESKTIIIGTLGEQMKMFKVPARTETTKMKSFKVKRVIQKKGGRKRIRRKGSFRTAAISS